MVTPGLQNLFQQALRLQFRLKKQDSQGITERILPSCKQDIGESLSAYLQADLNIAHVYFKCKYFFKKNSKILHKYVGFRLKKEDYTGLKTRILSQIRFFQQQSVKRRK